MSTRKSKKNHKEWVQQWESQQAIRDSFSTITLSETDYELLLAAEKLEACPLNEFLQDLDITVANSTNGIVGGVFDPEQFPELLDE